MLELKNVSYSVSDDSGTADILKDVSLAIEDRKFIVITGPNGGGKTTLAKAVMGIVPLTSGQILLDGEDITGLNVTERARRGIAFGFQQPPRFKGIRVKDLLGIASDKKVLSKGEACNYLTQVGLCAKDYLDREVDASLSGGEVKRIEIATMLARDSKFAIYDEPEAGIDLWSFDRLVDTFRSIHDDGDHTIVIISHQERIIQLADQSVLLENGHVEAAGTPDELLPMLGVARKAEGAVCHLTEPILRELDKINVTC